MRRTSRSPVLVALLLAASLSCRSSHDAPVAPPVELVGAGATFPYPLYRAWISEYGAAAGQHINYLAVGSAEGIRLLGEGKVDFGATDFPDTLPGAAPCARLFVPMLVGPIAVVYNLPSLRGAAPLRLDATLLAAIFSGRIARWDDRALARANPGVSLPHLPVTVVHRGVGSGTSRAFQAYLATSGRWRERAGAATAWPVGVTAEGNDGVAMEVQVTEGAIGYTQLAYARQDRLQAAVIDGRSPDDPAASYPIVARTWLVLDPQRAAPERRVALAAFVRWALHRGMEEAPGMAFAPPAPDTVARYDSLVAAFAHASCAASPAAGAVSRGGPR